MTQYIFIILSLILLAIFLDNLNLKLQSKKILYVVCSCFIFVFFATFRAENIGGDLGNYLPWYDEATLYDFSSYMDRMDKNGGKLFFVCNYIFSNISTNHTFYLFITSLFTLSSISVFISRYSKYVWLSFILFICMGYFNNTLNNVRSSLAYAIILYSYPYIFNRKFVKFLTTYLIALLFHSSVAPFIISYFLINRFIKPYITITIGFLCYLVASYLKNTLLIVMSLYSDKYAYADVLYSNSSGFSLFILLISILIFCTFNLNNKSKSSRLFFNIFSIAIWIQPLASVAGNLNRLTQIFAYSIMIILPNCIANIKNKLHRSVTITVTLILLITYYIFFILKINPSTGTNSSATVPYVFIWNQI